METTKDDELWSYIEPHESGGECETRMTRRQAIDWMRKHYKDHGIHLNWTDDNLFGDWCILHSATRAEEEPKIEIIKKSAGDFMVCVHFMGIEEVIDALAATIDTLSQGEFFIKGLDKAPSNAEIEKVYQELRLRKEEQQCQADSDTV